MGKTFYALAAGSMVIAAISIIGFNRLRKKRKKH